MKAAGRRATGKAVPGANSDASARKRLAGWLEKRFLVRFHVLLILAFSFAVGLLTTRALLHVGLETMHWRWPLALLAAYGAFLLGLRVWLSYVGLGRYLDDRSSLELDLPDVGFSSSGGGSGGVTGGSGWIGDAIESAGGGRFGGAGASGDFSELVGGGSVGSGSSSGISLPNIDLPDVGGDDGCLPIIVLGIILALLAAVFGVGVYLVWQAPLMLAEVAFEAALAGGLVRSARKVSNPGWVGGALGASWKQFALILLFTVATAILAEKYAPEAHSLPQAIQKLKE